ncbi:MAG: hypothetical protein P9M05_00010 [Candidatus Stygibacter australis]|nr:hypothetical protein [Candidatus Stygibacter australis]
MRFSKYIILFVFSVIIVILGGCAAPSGAVDVREVDPSVSIKGVSGLGIESKDIVTMTSKMVTDILSDPKFVSSGKVPKIIIDDRRFMNESNQMINLNMLLDRLRIELMRASNGRLEFVSRENMDIVLEEKKLEMQGYTESDDDYSIYTAAADYRMIGKITSLSTTSNKTGIRSNYLQFSFEMLDLDQGLSIWGNIYEVKKYGADDTIYH